MHASALSWPGSINNIIYTKLTEVFAALVDAATLAGNWIVVDRTDGSGSATAEILLELALSRGAVKPVIIVIDSLERLGSAKTGSNSHGLLRQLQESFAKEGIFSQEPNGSEPECPIDWGYSHDDFIKASDFAGAPDDSLPFDVVKEHQRKAYNNTCDPNRKWRYFYVDGIFRSGSHLVLKSNDRDEFNMNDVGSMGYLFAHGDSRTFKRLRVNIQQGRPTVMLHNSGGVVTAYSWLQRVMKHQRPPPDTVDLQGPLRYIISNVSEVCGFTTGQLTRTTCCRDLSVAVIEPRLIPAFPRVSSPSHAGKLDARLWRPGSAHDARSGGACPDALSQECGVGRHLDPVRGGSP